MASPRPPSLRDRIQAGSSSSRMDRDRCQFPQDVTTAWPLALCFEYFGRRELSFGMVQPFREDDEKPYVRFFCSKNGPHCRPSADDLRRDFGETYRKSGRQDLNLRPLRPERSALAKLSYAP